MNRGPSVYDENNWSGRFGTVVASCYEIDEPFCDVDLDEPPPPDNKPNNAIHGTPEIAATRPSSFWLFVAGIASVLDFFPAPGRFDRWRIKDSVPENEWTMLFHELATPLPDEHPTNGPPSS